MAQIGKMTPTVHLTLQTLETNALEFFPLIFSCVFIHSNECKSLIIFLKWHLEDKILKNSGTVHRFTTLKDSWIAGCLKMNSQGTNSVASKNS